jgi:multicomponent Na+:H+ antiporter subunit G
MSLLEVLATVLIGLGAAVMLAGAAGVVRFPDLYTRLHAAGKGDTLGQALVLLGLMLLGGASLLTVKLAFVVLLVLLLNPTATHALARSGWIVGIQPWGCDAVDGPTPELPTDETPGADLGTASREEGPWKT